MSFADWQRRGLLKSHAPSKQEIGNLLSVVDRCLADANIKEVSIDGRFQAAYNAALAAATVALYASGHRTNPAAPGHHAVTLGSLADTIGADAKAVRKLDGFRRKRHRASYDIAGGVSVSELAEMLKLATSITADVKAWLDRSHASLL